MIEEEKNKYPYLGITSNGLIVLFTTPLRGIVIKDNNYISYGIGYCGVNWCEKEFIRMRGNVTLRNN